MKKNPLSDSKQPRETLLLISQIARLWWLNSDVQNDYIKPLGNQITSSDVQALWELGVSGAIRPSTLAYKLGLDKASITHRISRLITQGLVEKVPDPEDGRASLVGLTSKGMKVVEQSYAISNKGFDWITRKWSEEDITAFTTYLRKYLEGTYRLLDGDS